jgi:hypothetical protein
MRKLLFLVLVGVFISSMSYTDEFATVGRGQTAKIWVEQVDNTGGVYQKTNITATRPQTIAAGSRLLGYSLVPYDPTKHYELIVGMYDDVVGIKGGTVNELTIEAEADVTLNGERWFPYPLTIITRLIVSQGANTTLLIYYEK